VAVAHRARPERSIHWCLLRPRAGWRIGPGTEDACVVVFLGTGTPGPARSRQGPSLAVIAGDKAYLVDVGVGVVRQANAACVKAVRVMNPKGLDIAFVSDLHSEHTLGLPDLILTPWIR